MLMTLRAAALIWAILAGALLAPVVAAQTLTESGKTQLELFEEISFSEPSVVSQGTLVDLETDTYFAGDFQAVFNQAFTILDGYRLVERGGYFPENAGIAPEQQLTATQAVYRVFELENGNRLTLYRSPIEDTSRYFIQELPQ
ncbi:MAG: hypothetical protein AAF289_10415 [Cyanobacteria bacterium P01_A01_bin.135]